MSGQQNETTIQPKIENNLTQNPKENQNSNNSQNNNNQKNVGKKRKLDGRVGNNNNSGGGERSSHGTRDGQPLQQWTRLTGAPAWDLPPNDQNNQTFTGRCRLFVANLPQNVTEDSLRALFGEFGKISDIYIGKGNQFSFIKMDTRMNAEHAKQALDGKMMDGRTLRVRLAAHASAIRVTQLPPLVSNELLHLAFSSFGTVERAIVSADDRGRSLSEGIVEFARKSSSQAAIKKCQNECLLMSSTPIPVVVQPLETRDEEEGVPEKSVLHASDYRSERELGPRFADPHSLEWEMARKWKQLSQIEAQRREALEMEFKELRDSLKQQMEGIKIEETVKQLREQLRQMERQSQQLCEEREQRIECERRREEQRRQTELVLRQQESELLRRQQPEHDLGTLRRQESELRQQANALQQLLDRQEAALRSMNTSEMGSALQPNIGQLDTHLNAIQSQTQQNSNQGLIFNPNVSSINAQTIHHSQQQNPNPFSLQTHVPQLGPTMRAHPQTQQQQHYGSGGGRQMGGPNQGGAQNQYLKRNRRFN